MSSIGHQHLVLPPVIGAGIVIALVLLVFCAKEIIRRRQLSSGITAPADQPSNLFEKVSVQRWLESSFGFSNNGESRLLRDQLQHQQQRSSPLLCSSAHIFPAPAIVRRGSNSDPPIAAGVVSDVEAGALITSAGTEQQLQEVPASKGLLVTAPSAGDEEDTTIRACRVNCCEDLEKGGELIAPHPHPPHPVPSLSSEEVAVASNIHHENENETHKAIGIPDVRSENKAPVAFRPTGVYLSPAGGDNHQKEDEKREAGLIGTTTDTSTQGLIAGPVIHPTTESSVSLTADEPRQSHRHLSRASTGHKQTSGKMDGSFVSSDQHQVHNKLMKSVGQNNGSSATSSPAVNGGTDDGGHGNNFAGANDPTDQQLQQSPSDAACPDSLGCNNETATGNEVAKIVPPSSLPVFPTTSTQQQHSLSSGELFQHGSQKSPNAEIDKGSIKEQLHEIISEIEMDLSKQQQAPRLLQPLTTSTQPNTHHHHVPSAAAEAAESNHSPELATARPAFGTTSVDNSDTSSFERHSEQQENSIHQMHRPLPQPQQQLPPVTTEKYNLHQPAQHHQQETPAPQPTFIAPDARLMTMTPDCSSDALFSTGRSFFSGMSNNPHDRLSSSSSITMLESPSLPFRARRVGGLMSPAPSSGSSRNNRYSWQPPSGAKPMPNTTWDGGVSSHTMLNNNEAPTVIAPSSVMPNEPMMDPQQGLASSTAAADGQQKTTGGEFITAAAAMEQPSAVTAPWQQQQQEHGADSNKENVPTISSSSTPAWAASSSEAAGNNSDGISYQKNADYVQEDEQQKQQHETSSFTAMTRMEEAEVDQQQQQDEESQHQQERRVSFEKLMQPAEDAALLATPRRRKMFGSSSFYNEPRNMYPTVEEQFELARRISESLVAEDNKTSKGQTMYVKRKKRSVKWITQGPEGLLEPPPLTDSKTVDTSSFLVPSNAAGNGFPDNDAAAAGPTAYQQDWTAGAPAHPSTVSDGERASHQQTPGSADGSSVGNSSSNSKPCLKFVLNPVQVRDALSTRNSAIYNDHTKLSPDVFLDLVKDLNSPTGKGAQLFAKRKKKAEKWIVDETTVLASSAASNNPASSSLQQTQTHQQEVTSTTTTTTSYDSFSTISSLVGQQQQGQLSNAGGTGKTPLAQLIEQQNAEIQRRLEHLNSKVKLVKSPWEAALETGYVDSAFAKQQQQETPSAAVPLMMQQASHQMQQFQPSVPTMGYTTWSPSGVPVEMGTSMAPSVLMEQPTTTSTNNMAASAGEQSSGHPSTFSPMMTHRDEHQEPEDSLMMGAAGNDDEEEAGVVVGRVQLRPGRSQQRQQQQQRRPVSMRERSYDSIYNTCPRGWDPNWLSEIPRSIHRPTFVPCTAGNGRGHSGADDVGQQNDPPSTASGNSNQQSFVASSNMMRRLSAEAPAAAQVHRHQQQQQQYHQRQGVTQAPSTGVSTHSQHPVPVQQHNNQQRLLLNRTLDERATSFATARQQQQQQHFLPSSFPDGHRQLEAPSSNRVNVSAAAADGLLLDASMDTAMTKRRRDEDANKYKRRSMIADFGSLNNYNTLPRGWGRPSAGAIKADVVAGGGGGGSSSRGTNASTVRTCSPAPAADRHHQQQQQPMMTSSARPASGYYKPCQFFTQRNC